MIFLRWFFTVMNKLKTTYFDKALIYIVIQPGVVRLSQYAAEPTDHYKTFLSKY